MGDFNSIYLCQLRSLTVVELVIFQPLICPQCLKKSQPSVELIPKTQEAIMDRESEKIVYFDGFENKFKKKTRMTNLKWSWTFLSKGV